MPLIRAGVRLRNLVDLVARITSVFRSIAIIVAIALVFLFGVATTVYLSLRSPEVQVPDVVGKNKFEAEKILAEADLKFRVRATRPSTEAQADTVMFQLPRAGEVVKTGQTVAMDISRDAKAGESSEKVTPTSRPRIATPTQRQTPTRTNQSGRGPRTPTKTRTAIQRQHK